MPSENKFDHRQINRSIPATTVIPILQYPNADAAVKELCDHYGFAERLKIGSHRVQLAVGHGAVIVAQGPSEPTEGGTQRHSVMVRVMNVDEHYAGALKAGATCFGGPQTFPYGERQYSAQDSGGHVWTFSQSIQDSDPASWGGELVLALPSEA